MRGEEVLDVPGGQTWQRWQVPLHVAVSWRALVPIPRRKSCGV